MVSGKYSALSGALSREQAMANITSNLANVNTHGFRKNRVSFEALLEGSRQTESGKGINYTKIGEIGTDFSQGPLQQTGRPLDVALSGEGFFKVRRGRDILLTRNGNFFVDANGMLKTAQGYNVLGPTSQPVQILDLEGSQVQIDESGAVSINNIPSGERLGVFTVDNPDGLRKAGDTLFSLDPKTRTLPAEETRVVQHFLEGSNVNMVEEMVLMIDAQRKFEANLKAQKSYSTLGEKQSELGTVG